MTTKKHEASTVRGSRDCRPQLKTHTKANTGLWLKTSPTVTSFPFRDNHWKLPWKCAISAWRVPNLAFNHDSWYTKHNLLLLTQAKVVVSTMSANSSCSKANNNIRSKCCSVQLYNLGSQATSLSIFSYYFKAGYSTNHTYYFAFKKGMKQKLS